MEQLAKASDPNSVIAIDKLEELLDAARAQPPRGAARPGGLCYQWNSPAAVEASVLLIKAAILRPGKRWRGRGRAGEGEGAGVWGASCHARQERAPQGEGSASLHAKAASTRVAGGWVGVECRLAVWVQAARPRQPWRQWRRGWHW
jgi:hypothetical protein